MRDNELQRVRVYVLDLRVVQCPAEGRGNVSRNFVTLTRRVSARGRAGDGRRRPARTEKRRPRAHPAAPGATRGAGRASRAIWIRRGDPLQHPTEGGTPNVSIRLPILAANAQTDRSEVRHTSRMEWMRHTSLRGPSSRAAGISLAPGLKLPSRFPVDRIDLGHLTSDIGDRHLADRGAVRSLLLA